MKDLNTWTGVGRLTRDAELKYTQGGFAITTFALASTESVKKGEKWEDYTNYLDCKLLGRMGEGLGKYLTKGKQVAITARLHQDRWEKDGQKRSKMVLVVDDIQLIGDKGQAKPQEAKAEVYQDDPIPF